MSQDCIIHTQAFYGYVSYAGIILCRIPCPNSSRATCSVRGYSSVSTDSSRSIASVFRVLVESDEPMTIDAVAEAVDRERSTAYRSVQRLLQTGFITKEQINYDRGGYYHVYSPTDPEKITDEMQRMLNDWYAKMGQLIQEFEEKYDRSETESATVSS